MATKQQVQNLKSETHTKGSAVVEYPYFFSSKRKADQE
jgi:hypothetical protein